MDKTEYYGNILTIIFIAYGIGLAILATLISIMYYKFIMIIKNHENNIYNRHKLRYITSLFSTYGAKKVLFGEYTNMKVKEYQNKLKIYYYLTVGYGLIGGILVFLIGLFILDFAQL